MKPARILKIKKINQSSLRQMVDLEEMFRFGIPAIAFFIAFILTPGLNLQLRVLIVGFVVLFCWVILNTEVDRQPAYTLIIPYIRYFFSKKAVGTVTEIDFDLVDNLLISKDKILAVFKLEPIDLMLLSEQDQNIFIKNIQNFLNNQRGIHTQIIMRNRGAEQSDYLGHFNSIINQEVKLKSEQMTELRDEKLAGYISDMKQLLSKNIVPIRDYYIIFEIKGNPDTTKRALEMTENLAQLSNRLCNLLAQAKIETKQVVDQELEIFLKEFIRQV